MSPSLVSTVKNIYQELGLSEEEIEALTKEGVI